MTDMLVKLYALPELEPLIKQQAELGIAIRRAMSPEKHIILKWVRTFFGASWESQCDLAMGRHPISCFIAVQENQIIGFACYDGTVKDVFGPTGVSEQCRGQGTGKALLLIALHDMHAQGYVYAVIGGAGPKDFYTKAVGAVEIADSSPGFYQGMLREK